MNREAWSEELRAAKRARGDAVVTQEWRHLERAHVLSQPRAGLHLRTHVAMLACAFRRRDVHEVAGQMFRLVVAAPGSWTGRYPVGNTGGSNVSAFRPMPIPDDLRALMETTDDAPTAR